MKIIIDICFILIAMILMMSIVYACPEKPVQRLPAHLFKDYCSCYQRIFLTSHSLVPRAEHAELICAGRAWDRAHKESLVKRKFV